MGIYRKPRSPFWYMCFCVDGRQVHASTRTPDRKLALSIYRAALAEVDRGGGTPGGGGTAPAAPAPAVDRTVEELLEAFERRRAARADGTNLAKEMGRYRRLLEHFGGLTLSGVTRSIVSAYKDRRREEGAAPATINKELGLLGAAFNVAIREWEWTDRNPVAMVAKEKVDNFRDRWLEDDEERRLLAASPQWLRDVVVFAVNSGLRQGELVRLRWEDVSMARRTIYIGRQKNGGKDELPLYEEALAVLRSRERMRPIGGGPVFCSSEGCLLEQRNLVRDFTSAKRRAGIENFRFHDLRHTFATRLAHAGVDASSIQRLMRHKSTVMTQRYTHHNVESLRRAVDMLARRPKNYCTFIALGGSGAPEGG